MTITYKTPEEIVLLREAGRRLATVVAETAKLVKPGVVAKDLDAFAATMIADFGDRAAFKGYQPDGADFPYPATLIVSINEEIVHGIPGDQILQNGDIVTLDCGLVHKGLYVDHAITVPVGVISSKTQKLLDITQQALVVGINAAQPGFTTGDIGNAIESFIKGRYGIVKGLAGHGVGYGVHEMPFVPNFGKAGTGAALKEGMVLAIEPMLSMGSDQIELLDDGYTIVTTDRSLSAHFEHTVVITNDGPMICTIQ